MIGEQLLDLPLLNGVNRRVERAADYADHVAPERGFSSYAPASSMAFFADFPMKGTAALATSA